MISGSCSVGTSLLESVGVATEPPVAAAVSGIWGELRSGPALVADWVPHERIAKRAMPPAHIFHMQVAMPSPNLHDVNYTYMRRDCGHFFGNSGALGCGWMHSPPCLSLPGSYLRSVLFCGSKMNGGSIHLERRNDELSVTRNPDFFTIVSHQEPPNQIRGSLFAIADLPPRGHLVGSPIEGQYYPVGQGSKNGLSI